MKSFEDTIETIEGREFSVNCSDEVNRGKHGNVDDIGYLCSIKVTPDTRLSEQDGTPLKFEDFATGDTIRIVFSKGRNISTRNRNFDAAEIVRLARNRE